jgi:hypothetical protein
MMTAHTTGGARCKREERVQRRAERKERALVAQLLLLIAAKMGKAYSAWLLPNLLQTLGLWPFRVEDSSQYG